MTAAFVVFGRAYLYLDSVHLGSGVDDQCSDVLADIEHNELGMLAC